MGSAPPPSSSLSWPAPHWWSSGSSASRPTRHSTPAQGSTAARWVGFEVNGIHNVVHIGSGLLLLAGARRPGSARAVCLIFGITYGLVTLIGLIDGDTVLGLIPVNPADNVLHIGLTVLALAFAFVQGHDRDPAADRRTL
jgi:Domain of unknown function (DUF4383)